MPDDSNSCQSMKVQTRVSEITRIIKSKYRTVMLTVNITIVQGAMVLCSQIHITIVRAPLVESDGPQSLCS
jgi:hypothetical protein